MLSRAMAIGSKRSEMLVDAADLRQFTVDVFEAVGLSTEDAWIVSEALVGADLRGVHSHGVQNLPRWARGYAHGLLNAEPRCELVVDAGALCIMDGDRGLGAVVGRRAMDLAIARAQASGVAMVGVRNSSHFGTAASLAMRALDHDQIGYCTTNGPAVMAPWAGRDSVLCNNPFSYAIPTRDAPPIVFDAACSASARGRIRAHARDGEPIPLGWAIDSEGSDTTDAARALTGAVLPFGAHKGYGMAVVNEVLAGALTGALFSYEMEVGASSAEDEIRRHAQDAWGCGHWLAAIDIGRVVPLEAFKERVSELVERLHGTPPRDGFDRVLVPGEIEYWLSLERERDGIPLSPSIVEIIDAFAVDELDRAPLAAACAVREVPT